MVALGGARQHSAVVEVAETLLASTVRVGASRQVVAAVASAVMRTVLGSYAGGHDCELLGSGLVGPSMGLPAAAQHITRQLVEAIGAPFKGLQAAARHAKRGCLIPPTPCNRLCRLD